MVMKIFDLKIIKFTPEELEEIAMQAKHHCTCQHCTADAERTLGLYLSPIRMATGYTPVKASTRKMLVKKLDKMIDVISLIVHNADTNPLTDLLVKKYDFLEKFKAKLL